MCSAPTGYGLLDFIILNIMFFGGLPILISTWQKLWDWWVHDNQITDEKGAATPFWVVIFALVPLILVGTCIKRMVAP